MKKSIATMTKFFKGKGAAEDVPITTDIGELRGQRKELKAILESLEKQTVPELKAAKNLVLVIASGDP